MARGSQARMSFPIPILGSGRFCQSLCRPGHQGMWHCTLLRVLPLWVPSSPFLALGCLGGGPVPPEQSLPPLNQLLMGRVRPLLLIGVLWAMFPLSDHGSHSGGPTERTVGFYQLFTIWRDWVVVKLGKGEITLVLCKPVSRQQN